MILEGVLMNIFAIFKMAAIFQWLPPISYWKKLGKFLFPEPIILCNSTFLGL